MSRTRVWVLASRPKTLWASVSPVIVGSAVAWRDGLFHWSAAIVALIGAMLIQIGTNLANDLFDHLRGADTHDRQGPTRVTQAGLVSPRQVRIAMVLVFALAFICGIFLASRGGWPIVAIGLTSIAAAFLYTGGPYPFGYHGWGDIFVFIFFGPIAVVGTYFVQAGSASSAVWIASIPMGALATAILVVNNLRDMKTDRRAGKKTLAVRIGRYGSIGEYALLLLVAGLVPAVLVILRLSGYGVFLATGIIAVALPILLGSIRSHAIPKQEGILLNKLLAQTALMQIIYAVAFAVGVNL